MVENPFKSRLDSRDGKVNNNPFESRLQSKSNENSEESGLKSAARYATQIPLGIAEGTNLGIGANLLNLLGLGEALDESEIERIKEIAAREGVKFDEEKYRQGVKTAFEAFPTVGNIARQTEEATGLPLTAKTKGQNLLRMASTAGKAIPGSVTQKTGAAIVAPSVKEIASASGVPEPLAEILGYGTAGIAAGKIPSNAPSITQATKPSGLPIRRFENLESPRAISAKRLGKINEKLETDFRKISDEILNTSSIAETRASLKENPSFKSEVADRFKTVEKLAGDIDTPLHTDTVKRALMNNVLNKKGTGFSPSEYDTDYKNFVIQSIKETPSQNITAVDLVKQYRKNNSALSEAYDPGKSYAFNRAKKDALLEYNRAISKVIDEEFPGTEFSNLFKSTNKEWAQISDAQAIDKFIDGVFEKGLDFYKGKKFFDNENIARPFKRVLGDEGFENFKTLMNDLMTSEKPYKMLKVAEKQGWGDLAHNAMAYIIHPKLGIAKAGYSAAKNTFKELVNSLLDKPQLTISWKNGIESLKKGDFESANNSFKDLRFAIEDATHIQKSISQSNPKSKTK